MNKNSLSGAAILGTSILVGTFLVCQTVFGNSVTSSVVVGNSAPTITAVSVNGGSAITLNPNATTSINVNATVNSNNGCGNLTGGTTTILLYRNGVGSSTCISTPNNLNCYIATSFTASSTCVGNGTSINTTTTLGLFYFAQATDASSSFSGQGWRATVIFRDPSNATGSTDSATTPLNTLLAINVTTSTINYGSLVPGSTSANQTTTVANAGNASSSLQTSAQSTLVSGANVIATSSEHYATSSFTYGGTEQILSGSAASVSGFLLTSPTSTSNVISTVFWGLQVPNGTPTGTYAGTNLLTAVFNP